LTIAHSLETKVKSLETAARNANDAISLIHLGEGALDAVSGMLVRLRELATQALNGTYSATDRDNLDAEFQQLISEITRISDNTYFNGINVIGSTSTLSFQIGYDSDDSISLTLQDMASTAIGNVNTSEYLDDQDVDTVANAGDALDSVDAALSDVDSYRVAMGAVANRLNHTVENLYSRIEQQTAAKSRIQDADYAVESANLARAQVLQQAGTAMLAQANASTMNVLSLLK
jgi:flagellin